MTNTISFSNLLFFGSLHIVRCNEVLVENVTIYGDFNTPNNDGIDIEDTNNTRIVGCHIDTGDDAICPKTYAGPLYNLTVTDCWIRTKSSAVKFGSATFHDFHGLRFERLTIKDSHRGLAFQLRDGGMISCRTPTVVVYALFLPHVQDYLAHIWSIVCDGIVSMLGDGRALYFVELQVCFYRVFAIL